MSESATTATVDRLLNPPDGFPATFRVIESVGRELDDQEMEKLKGRVSHAVRHFPELGGRTVTVAKKPEEHTWYAEADTDNDIIFLPTYEPCPYITICHEIGHLAITVMNDMGYDVPVTSEEFCSIFSVARMPHDRIDSPEIAYLGEPSIPRKQWPVVCQRALRYREEHHNYVQQCKKWLQI